MAKLMLEHENWVDLINVENGVIRLNGELAIETARQKIQAKIEEVEANLKGAQENRNNTSIEIQLLKKKVAAYKLATQAALTYAQAAGIGAMMGDAVNQIANLERHISERQGLWI